MPRGRGSSHSGNGRGNSTEPRREVVHIKQECLGEILTFATIYDEYNNTNNSDSSRPHIAWYELPAPTENNSYSVVGELVRPSDLFAPSLPPAHPSYGYSGGGSSSSSYSTYSSPFIHHHHQQQQQQPPPILYPEPFVPLTNSGSPYQNWYSGHHHLSSYWGYHSSSYHQSYQEVYNPSYYAIPVRHSFSGYPPPNHVPDQEEPNEPLPPNLNPNRSGSPSDHSSYIVHWLPAENNERALVPVHNHDPIRVSQAQGRQRPKSPTIKSVGVYTETHPGPHPADTIGDLAPIPPPPGEAPNPHLPQYIEALRTRPSTVVDSTCLDHYAEVKFILTHLISYDGPLAGGIRPCIDGHPCPYFPGFTHFNPRVSGGVLPPTRGRRSIRGRGRGSNRRGRGAYSNYETSNNNLVPEQQVSSVPKRGRGVGRRGRARETSVIVGGPNVVNNYYNTRSSSAHHNSHPGASGDHNSLCIHHQNQPRRPRGPIPAALGAAPPSEGEEENQPASSPASTHHVEENSNDSSRDEITHGDVITFWSSEDSGESGGSRTLFSSSGSTNCPGPSRKMTNKGVKVKKENLDCASSNEESPEALDLSRTNAVKQCCWCHKHMVEQPLGMESEFCSEICFDQYRRDSFKKRAACIWCNNSSKSGINLSQIQNIDESKFCSEHCLAQFKLRLFCEETSTHLDQLKEITQNGANAGNINSSIARANRQLSVNDLITPDLWLRSTSNQVSISDPPPPNLSPYSNNLFFPNLGNSAGPSSSSGRKSSNERSTASSSSNCLKHTNNSSSSTTSHHYTRSTRDSSPAKKRLKTSHSTSCPTPGPSSRNSAPTRRNSPLETILNSNTRSPPQQSRPSHSQLGGPCAPNAVNGWDRNCIPPRLGCDVPTPYNLIPEDGHQLRLDLAGSSSNLNLLLSHNSSNHNSIQSNGSAEPPLASSSGSSRDRNHRRIGSGRPNPTDESPDPATSPEVDMLADSVRNNRKFALAVERHRKKYSSYSYRMVPNPHIPPRTRSKKGASNNSNVVPTKSIDEETTSDGDEMGEIEMIEDSGTSTHPQGHSSSVSIQLPSYVAQQQGVLPPVTIMVPVPFPVPIPIPIPIFIPRDGLRASSQGSSGTGPLAGPSGSSSGKKGEAEDDQKSSPKASCSKSETEGKEEKNKECTNTENDLDCSNNEIETEGDEAMVIDETVAGTIQAVSDESSAPCILLDEMGENTLPTGEGELNVSNDNVNSASVNVEGTGEEIVLGMEGDDDAATEQNLSQATDVCIVNEHEVFELSASDAETE